MKHMKRLGFLRGILLLAMVLSLTQTSCTGKKGDKGNPGAPGSDSPTPTTLARSDDLPGAVMTITGVYGATGHDGSFQVGDHIKVEFTIKKNDGNNLPLSELDFGGIMVSGPSFNYQRVLAEQMDLRTASVHNSDGSWSYTFASAIPATYLAPLNDTSSFGSTDGELQGQALLAGTYTVGLEIYKNYTIDGNTVRDVGNATEDFLFGGATTIEHREVVARNNCNRCHFNLQAHGGIRRLLTLCVLCHTSGAEDRNVPAVEGGTPGLTIDSRVMFHKMHNGRSLPSVLGVVTLTDGSGGRSYQATPTPYKIVGFQNSVNDFSTLAYPVWPSLDRPMPRNLGYSLLSSTVPSSTDSERTRDDTLRKGVVACAKCHGDPDGSGTLEAPAQGSIIYAQPTRRACGACHDDVNWSQPYAKNGLVMPPQSDDSSCINSGCHGTTDTLSVAAVHTHPIVDPTANTGVNFEITSLTGGGGAGGNFQAGDGPTITFTLKDDAGSDLPLDQIDSTSVTFVGQNSNRQFVLPNQSVNPFDFTGRLATATTTNKAIMSKVIGATVQETLTLQFSSATAFTVTGSSSGSLGSSAFSTSPSTNASGSSIANVTLTSSAVAQTITVAFSSATAFSVTGSTSGAMGSGTLPATTSGSTRFTSTDGTVAFNVTVGTTAITAGQNIYLVVFKGSGANPVLFALVAGRTSVAANDRFYYEVWPAASSYTINIPMDLTLELLGEGDGTIGQVLTAGNLPVYYGRQTLFERTALAGATTTLTADAVAGDRNVKVADVLAATLAANDYVVLDDGVAGAEEYLRVSSIDSTNKLIWFGSPLRYDHATGVVLQEATMTYRQEGVNYTLNAGAGTVTSLVAFASGNPLVMNYRTDSAFGWKRSPSDTIQATYYSPLNNAADYDVTWGEWENLDYLDGTYQVGIWGYKNYDLGLNNELQTYRFTSNSATKDFLYGAATEIEHREVISSPSNCDSCHNMVMFHGGSRRGLDTCLFCHGESGAQTLPTPTEAGATIEFRNFLHKVHKGGDLAFADQFLDGAFEDVGFPALSGGVKNCRACHGTSDAWMEPAERDHPDQPVPTRVFRTVCNSCHDETDATAHINIMTSSDGVESCGVCHGTEADFRVEFMHKVR